MKIQVYHKGTLIKEVITNLRERDCDPTPTFTQRVAAKEAAIRVIMDDFNERILFAIKERFTDVQVCIILESRIQSATVDQPKRVSLYTPRVPIPQKDPITWTRAKAVYSNPSH